MEILRKRQWSSTRSRGLGPICAADVASSQVVFQTGWVVCARRTDPRARGCRRGLEPGPRTMRLSPRMCPTCVSPQEQLLRRCPLDFVSCSSIFFFGLVARVRRTASVVRFTYHTPSSGPRFQIAGARVSGVRAQPTRNPVLCGTAKTRAAGRACHVWSRPRCRSVIGVRRAEACLTALSPSRRRCCVWTVGWACPTAATEWCQRRWQATLGAFCARVPPHWSLRWRCTLSSRVSHKSDTVAR